MECKQQNEVVGARQEVKRVAFALHRKPLIHQMNLLDPGRASGRMANDERDFPIACRARHSWEPSGKQSTANKAQQVPRPRRSTAHTPSSGLQSDVFMWGEVGVAFPLAHSWEVPL